MEEIIRYKGKDYRPLMALPSGYGYYCGDWRLLTDMDRNPKSFFEYNINDNKLISSTLRRIIFPEEKA